MGLFSHPADLTPVCTTELVEFARCTPEFQRRNVALLGNSIDSVYAHIAWIRNIEERMGVKITFPVIADLDQKVPRLYGMIHEPSSVTAPVRCVFLIDQKRTLRAMIYYRASTSTRPGAGSDRLRAPRPSRSAPFRPVPGACPPAGGHLERSPEVGPCSTTSR